MPVVRQIVGVVEYGRLDPVPWMVSLLIVCVAAIVLVQPLAPLNGWRWLSAGALVTTAYAITRVWARASHSMMSHPYPYGAQWIRWIYVSVAGVIPIPGDRNCSQAPAGGRRPRCFLSYRGVKKARAIRIRDALVDAGIDVEMYDPYDRWADGPYEITERIDQLGDCVLYLELLAGRSRWVRVEKEWATRLGRPVYLHWTDRLLAATVQRIVRSTWMPKRSMGEATKVGEMDAAFRHVPYDEIRGSKALEPAPGVAMMRPVHYALRDFGRAMREGARLLRYVQVAFAVAAMGLATWLLPPPYSMMLLAGTIVVAGGRRLHRWYDRRS
jgi:hypothetical protein